jgi:acetyl-CoA C-acetyltransferase
MVHCAIAGGMENMDQAPYLLPQGRWGARMGDVTLMDSMLSDGLNDAFSGQHSGWHTEDLVLRNKISREDQDLWAQRSQQRFGNAQAANKFAQEIVTVEVPGRKGPTLFSRDEHNRRDTTLESLAKLKPAFRKDGTITAGSAPGLNSGAAAMLVVERAWAEQNGLKPMARLAGYGIAAVAPGLFGLGPVPAVQQALTRAGWLVGQVERVEINEAFAAIALACTRAGPCRGRGECGGRCHCTWPPHRGEWCRAGRAPAAFHATRWPQARRGNPVYWGRAGHCTGPGNAVTSAAMDTPVHNLHALRG